jgi:nucleoside-diphosphate-sugar epimerase
MDTKTISKVLKELKPQIIVNCAGIVENSDKALLNPVFVTNLLEGVVKSNLKLKRIITLGSAAEYGLVENADIALSEDSPLEATSLYGISKIQESAVIAKFREKYNLPIIVARVFNPIGVGMHHRFLIPKIISQVQEFRNGDRKSIEINRLDSKRDYVDVKDVALAIKSIIEGDPVSFVYNIGSGVSTSNQELLELILKNSKLKSRPEIIETSPNKEPIVAALADISRMKKEFGWLPASKLDDTVRKIIQYDK